MGKPRWLRILPITAGASMGLLITNPTSLPTPLFRFLVAEKPSLAVIPNIFYWESILVYLELPPLGKCGKSTGIGKVSTAVTQP